MYSVGIQGDLYVFFYVVQCDVVYFVVDYCFDFIIVYQIYQFVVDVDVVVGYGEGVDIFGFIDFVVYGLIIDVIVQCSCDFVQLLVVFIVGWGDFCFGVYFFIGLVV